MVSAQDPCGDIGHCCLCRNNDSRLSATQKVLRRRSLALILQIVPKENSFHPRHVDLATSASLSHGHANVGYAVQSVFLPVIRIEIPGTQSLDFDRARCRLARYILQYCCIGDRSNRQRQRGTVRPATFLNASDQRLYSFPQSDCSRVVTTTSGKSGDGPVSREFIGFPRRYASRNAAM